MSYRTIIVSLALLIPLALSAQTVGKRMSLVAPDEAAIIVYAEGTVKVNGQSVDIGARIPDGATLITGPDALAEIVFANKNILHIGAGSIVTLDLSKLQRTVNLEQGSVGAVLRKLDRLAGGSLDVRTKSAVAAVRGTTFFSQYEPEKPDTSYYCICNGKIELANPDGAAAAAVSAAHHEAHVRTMTAEGANDVAGTLVGHDDKLMEAMAARIGETIDWTKVED